MSWAPSQMKMTSFQSTFHLQELRKFQINNILNQWFIKALAKLEFNQRIRKVVSGAQLEKSMISTLGHFMTTKKKIMIIMIMRSQRLQLILNGFRNQLWRRGWRWYRSLLFLNRKEKIWRRIYHVIRDRKEWIQNNISLLQTIVDMVMTRYQI